MSVPLKLKDSASADFVQFSSTEENYLAYLASLELASSPSGVGALNKTGSGIVVGSLVDTSFDQNVNDDATNATFTTVTTTISQGDGSVTLAAGDHRKLVSTHLENGQRTIREMSSTDTDALLDRIGSRIFTSDYPGTYKLASTTPSGGYSTAISNVSTDTRTDGNSVQYNLYRRNSMTAPTKVLPFCIKRSNGLTGTYQGVQLMSDTQVQYSLGNKLKNKIAASNGDGIGSYLLLSSATGTPTNNGISGTWASKGSVTDTRNTIVSANYTRSRSSNFQQTRDSNYSADYQRTTSSVYTRASTTQRDSNYSAVYTKTRTSTFISSGFLGNFIGNYTRTTSGSYTRTSLTTQDYTRTSTVGGTSSYTGDFLGNFLGNYTGNYTGTTMSAAIYDIGASPPTTLEDAWVIMEYNTGNTRHWRVSIYSGGVDHIVHDGTNQNTAFSITSGIHSNGTEFFRHVNEDIQGGGAVGYWFWSMKQEIDVDFSGDYTRTSTRNRVEDFTRNTSASFTGNYQRNLLYTGNYSRDFLGEYTRDRQELNASGNFSRNFVGNYARDYTRTRESNYTRTSTRDSNRTSTRTSTRSRDASYLGDYLGNYARNFEGTYTRTRAADTDYTRSSGVVYSRNDNSKSGSTNYARYFIGNFVGGTFYTRTSTGVGNKGNTTYFLGNYQALPYVGNYAGNYARNYTDSYTRTSTTSFEGNFAGNFAGDFTGNFVGDYTRNFAGNYSRNFSRTRVSTYIGEESSTEDYLGNFTGDYARTFSETFLGNYSRNFAGNYIGDYGRNFIGDYSRTFAGNYTGTKISSGTQNIETFTLYVRTA